MNFVGLLFYNVVSISCLAIVTPSLFEIPSKPAEAYFVGDYAGLVHDHDLPAIKELQEDAYDQNSVPIVVVTIQSTSKCDWEGTVDSLARAWFNKWEIGTLKREGGNQKNAGMLLLVSSGDRKARIELGADWGRRWDSHCRQIMQQVMIPKFKEGDYSVGIREGVEALAQMANEDPASQPARVGFFERVRHHENITPLSMFGRRSGILLITVGILLCVGAIVFPQHRKWMFIVGITLILVVVFTPIIVGLILFFWKSDSGGGSGNGGYSYYACSRGGYSGGSSSVGGFSGGGGASGGW